MRLGSWIAVMLLAGLFLIDAPWTEKAVSAPPPEDRGRGFGFVDVAEAAREIGADLISIGPDGARFWVRDENGFVRSVVLPPNFPLE